MRLSSGSALQILDHVVQKVSGSPPDVLRRVRLIRRIEGLDEERAKQVAKVLNTLLDVMDENR